MTTFFTPSGRTAEVARATVDPANPLALHSALHPELRIEPHEYYSDAFLIDNCYEAVAVALQTRTTTSPSVEAPSISIARNLAGVAQTWNILQGAFNVGPSGIVPSPIDATTKIATIDSGTPNVDLMLKVFADSNSNQEGITYRVKDSDERWHLTVSGQNGAKGLYLFQWVPNNNIVTRAFFTDNSVTPGEARRIRIVVGSDNIHHCYLSSGPDTAPIERFAFTSASYATETKHGISHQRATSLWIQGKPI